VKYIDLFTPHHVATLTDWLKEKRRLCLEIYVPHGGGSPSYYTVESLAELKVQIENLARCLEIQITIWKNHTQAEFESDVAIPSDIKWIYTHTDEVMYFSVQKNRNWSASYQNDPEKYRVEIEEWNR
jgi:hypothetical protein